ncbi:MAG: type II toxin-antitoxin system death-on-curing family toxin [Hyphomicrobiaceae bacterium]
MRGPVWLPGSLVLAIQAEQLAIFGGASGVRDAGLLASALDRPRNKFAYGEVDLPALAAAYGYGIARNHPFIDGNKRTALLAIYTFLGLNDLEFDVDEAEAAVVIESMAAGNVSEAELAVWIAQHC